METIDEQSGGRRLHKLWSTAERIAELTAADHKRELGNLARVTGDRLRPQLEYVPRFAGHLAVGEIAIEPILGSLRVVAVERTKDLVHLTWKDDYGPCRPAGRYRTDKVLPVRTPGPTDRIFIERTIDQAVWRRTDIPHEVARLIAAHLHVGPRSMLYRFAVDGAILDDRLFDELDAVHRSRLAYRSWVRALTRYCIGREDLGPQLGWVPERAEAAEEATSSNGDGGQAARPRSGGPLTRRYVKTTAVRQLLDAAFDLGVAAARSKSSKSAIAGLARLRVRQTMTRKPGTTRRTVPNDYPCHRAGE